MATHFLTNRGKLEMIQGGWDDAGATDLRMGYIEGAAVPAGIDTEAEIQDLNFVADLLAISGVDEPTATNYARMTLDRSAATEDDTNNRVNMDAGNETLSAVATGDEIIAGFIFRFVTNDADSPLWSVFTLDVAIPTNGSDLTATISDLYRAT